MFLVITIIYSVITIILYLPSLALLNIFRIFFFLVQKMRSLAWNNIQNVDDGAFRGLQNLHEL